MKKIAILITFILAISLFLVACQQPRVIEPVKNPIVDSNKELEAKYETSQELKKFNSVSEIREYLDESMKAQATRSYAWANVALDEEIAFTGEGMVQAAAAPKAIMADATEVSTGGSASDFSQTNIQVKGVDEADFVKNDGKYIYIISQDNLVIVDAYPAEDAEILSKTEIGGYPENMFINGDRLVIFSVLSDETYVIPEYDYFPRTRYTQKTHAYIYDISDRSSPELVQDFNINGDYFQARMIGDYVYFISKDSVYYYNNIIDLPVIRAGAEKVITPDIYYFDNPENNFVFHTIASFNIHEDDDINAKSFLMGYSNNLYVSRDNIYISYQKNLPTRYYEEQNEERFYKVVFPLLPVDIQLKIKEVQASSDSSYETWMDISNILEEMYNRMEETEKDELVEKIEKAIAEYERQIEIERRKTVIQKISIGEGSIEYKAKGEVSGYLLNQFSFDEYDGNLRVATTTQFWTSRESVQYNNVYVLDKNMELIGSLEKLAEDESIYSTRFIGDRLYMVTFQRIDPLFVIDLSNPRNPKVLGELKIPGYSDYLHPYDEDHIIGIGKETKENEWGGVSTKGVKLALFDVSDVSNPKVIDKYEIGTSGTDSEALREHKAFLFDKNKNILVIPVREVKGERTYDRGYYRQRIWQGAYVFSLTPEDGFDVKGKISHFEGDEDYGYYWGSPYAVRRSLYMDDVLYTVSAKKLKMNDLSDIDDEINEIELPYKEERYRPIYY